jgi:catechol 2,3-dioxygenase-like lactoylglutathione lyase family enzyme|tara:strand:+ start:9018 stop:9323 length:306 start_codon:yes stop_codon:yes gene_type:complete
MKIDHIAIQVDDIAGAVEWYTTYHGAESLYVDDTWGMVQFENVKVAFVTKSQHPPHLAFRQDDLVGGKVHRDGSRSMYKRDPWGNIYELIKYPEEPKEALD